MPDPVAPQPVPVPVQRHAALREAAADLEASFLSQMLRSAGLGAQEGPFAGGPGEGQFASFLRDIHAREIARHGGIGLAEHIFEALKARSDAEG